MRSLVLSTATRFLLPLLLLFSVFALLRGHNQPGGGFIAGLVASAALSLYVLASGATAARRLLVVDPQSLIGLGLLLAAMSGMVAIFRDQPLMTGKWLTLQRWETEISVGTPLAFDVGVFLVVIGTVLLIVFSLAEE